MDKPAVSTVFSNGNEPNFNTVLSEMALLFAGSLPFYPKQAKMDFIIGRGCLCDRGSVYKLEQCMCSPTPLIFQSSLAQIKPTAVSS